MTEPALVDERHDFRYGWVFGAVWLVYLESPLTAAYHHRPGPMRDVGLAAVIAFAVVYLGFMITGRRLRQAGRTVHTGVIWLKVGVLVLLGCLMTAGAHDKALAFLPFVSAFAMFSLRTNAAWIATFALAIGTEVAIHTVPGWTDNGAGFGALLSAVAVFAIRLAFERNRRLLDTQEEMAQLAVSEERSRFARDLHDILGHSLTVIAVKAELAGRLIEDQPQRAALEIADLERLAREALADVRGAVSGYREISLARELVTARAALTVASIESDLPTTVDLIPTELNELFGWAVREGVTNVVRHSKARHCTIRVTETSVEIIDDGVGTCDGAAGNGLTGLKERATALGAHVERGACPLGHRLAVLVPSSDRVDA